MDHPDTKIKIYSVCVGKATVWTSREVAAWSAYFEVSYGAWRNAEGWLLWKNINYLLNDH